MAKRVKFPSESPELAEFIGIVLGDGNILAWKKGKKIRCYSVRIAGDAILDYDYLNNYVAQLAENLFQIKVNVYFSKRSRCMYLWMCGINLIKFLELKGLSHGNKLTNQSTIPFWVWTDLELLRACLRGLFDTDGSVYELLPHWPGLYQICFTNRNLTLLRDVRKALLHLGYNVSNISNMKTKNSSPRIYLTRKNNIEKFYKEIGFNNSKHYKKLIKLFN